MRSMVEGACGKGCTAWMPPSGRASPCHLPVPGRMGEMSITSKVSRRKHNPFFQQGQHPATRLTLKSTYIVLPA